MGEEDCTKIVTSQLPQFKIAPAPGPGIDEVILTTRNDGDTGLSPRWICKGSRCATEQDLQRIVFEQVFSACAQVMPDEPGKDGVLHGRDRENCDSNSQYADEKTGDGHDLSGDHDGFTSGRSEDKRASDLGGQFTKRLILIFITIPSARKVNSIDDPP